MPEDTTGIQVDSNGGSNETVTDEGFSTEEAAGAPTETTAISKDKWTAKYLWPYLNLPLLWIYRLIIAVLLTLVVITSITALVIGAKEALQEWGLWDGLTRPDLLTDLLTSIEYRILVVAIGSFVTGYMFMQGQFRKTFGMWFRPQRDSRQLPVERLAKIQKGVIAKEALKDFADRYTTAWCSQDAASVAAFFSENGSLKVNDNPKAVGRVDIAEVAQGFMTSFPDMRVLMNDLRIDSDRSAVYNWTLVGNNTGPGGTGKSVNIRGHEVWKIGDDGLIAKSQGHFDKDDYHRQLGIDVE